MIGATGVLLRLAGAGAAAADRLHPARRPLADQVRSTLPPGATFDADHAHRRSRRARSSRRIPEYVKLFYTDRRGGSATGADPFAAAAARPADCARRRSRIHLTPRGTRAASQAGRSRTSCATRSTLSRACAATSASAARARSTCWCCGDDARRLASARARVERDLRTHPRARQRHVDREPDPARDRSCGPTSRAPPTSASPRGDRRDAAHRDRRRLRPERCPSSTCAQRQVPIVVKLPPEARTRPRACSNASRVPGARGPVMLGRSRRWRSTAARP